MSLARVEIASVIGLAVTLFAASLNAQTPALNSTNFQVERFEPMPAQGVNVLNVATSDLTARGGATVGVFGHVAGNLLVRQNSEGEVTSRLLQNQLKAEVWAGVGLHDWIDLGLVMPLVLTQSGDALSLFDRPTESVNGAALGDLRVIPKVRLINPEESGGIGLAILPNVLVPTGDRTFNSDGVLRFEPRLALDWRRNDLLIGGNLAYAFRPKRQVGAYVSDDALRWAFGAHVPLPIDGIGVLATLFGDAPLNRDLERNGNNAPVELDLGVQYKFANDVVANIGGGAGLTGAVGSPSYRVFGSIGYSPRAKDSDGDGLLDAKDSCPGDPEDQDGFEDDDGCPDHDNDGDGILDEDDACPDEAEDLDGFEDPDGCRDRDNDGDGLSDSADECPDDAGPKERNGCPEGDTDGDGIGDDTDQCVSEPEDADNFQDDDGCPDVDNDADGVPDAEDQCPMEPEDVDGFEDDDGCPDPDNDGDGISDVNDKCPMQAETVDGKDDDDGCPEDTKVRITMSKIEILEKVFFDSGKATIRKRSFALLAEVAQVLQQNAQITGVRVEGHTDDRGDDKFNQKLSEDRAAAVKTHLVEVGGVDASRLESKGFGETRPIADNKRAAGRNQNRRVEFVITEINGESVATPLKQPSDAKPAKGESSEQEAPAKEGAAAEKEGAPKAQEPREKKEESSE